MAQNGRKTFSSLCEELSRRATLWTGSTWGFLLAVAVVVVWIATGPLFAFSDTWQLVINTGTTIVTFLMVFLLQRSQNKESAAVHIKLNEILAALEGASNCLINVEELSEQEVRALHQRYQQLAMKARNGSPPPHAAIEGGEAALNEIPPPVAAPQATPG